MGNQERVQSRSHTMKTKTKVRAGADTIIGSSIVIDGEISGDEDLAVQGG